MGYGMAGLWKKLPDSKPDTLVASPDRLLFRPPPTIICVFDNDSPTRVNPLTPGMARISGPHRRGRLRARPRAAFALPPSPSSSATLPYRPASSGRDEPPNLPPPRHMHDAARIALAISNRGKE